MIKINPALLVTNISDYYLQVAGLFPFVKEFDIDIIEWSRTDSKTISVEEALSIKADIVMNFDLMVEYPTEMIELLVRDKRVQTIILNTDCKENLSHLIDKIHFHWKRAGIAVNPEDNLEMVEGYLPDIELVEIFSIFPGAQGNPMLTEKLQLANVLKAKGFAGDIELDGGVNKDTIPEIIQYPFNVLSAGSALSRAENPIEAYKKLEKMANSVMKL